jgi:drug/metabolite transporter (DMT)-like permease
MASIGLLFALAAMLCWGVWTVLATLATRSLAPEAAMVVSYATGAALAFGYVLVSRGVPALPGRGVALAGLAGVFAGGGAVAFYAGLSRGSAAIVTTVSALYFVVAAILGVVVLGESLAVRDLAGIGFAVLAIALLAT